MIWDVTIHNINDISNNEGLDICIDENYWGHQVWGEDNIGPRFKTTKKPGVGEVGQIVMVNDMDLFLPREYVYCLRIQNHPANFKDQGPNVVLIIIDKLE